MPSDLLVPLDGSKAAENVLPVAATLSAAYDMRIRFLEAVDTTQHGPTGSPDPSRASELFGRYAEELAARHALNRGSWYATVIAGNPADVILGAAEQAGMIALATHGHGGFRAAVLGSVADRVVRGTSVPIVVVPATGEAAQIGPGPIVIAFDGSAESARALTAGREAAARLHREVLLLQAYSPALPAATGEGVDREPNILKEIEAGVHASLDAVAAVGEKMRALRGPTVDIIVNTAESVDAALLVVASSRKGAAKRLTIGSTTNSLLHSYRRPMLVVPRPFA